MALDHDGLFKVIGKYVKAINIWMTYVTALNTSKGEIFTVLEEENLEDYYKSVPDQFAGFQSTITNWISSVILNTRDILLDRDYVIDELSIYNFQVTDVLNGLYDYMIDNAETIKSSVVTLDTNDVDKAASESLISINDDPQYPILFCSRTLDGVNSPGNNVAAHLRYDGIESQLARSCKVTAELIDNSVVGSEIAQLYTGVTAVEPYQLQSETPGNGPAITCVEGTNNLVANHYNFNSWSGDSPDGWSVSGTITTDYVDGSAGNGTGPLRIKTQGVYALQKISNLEHHKLYYLGLFASINSSPGGGNNVIGIKLRTNADATIVSQTTVTLDTASTEDGVAYTFFRLPATVDLNDVYVEVEYVTEASSADIIDINKVVLTPAVYWNGLGWAYWVLNHTSSIKTYAALGHKTDIVIANNDAGLFQTFFRKAYAIQLPSADSPSIDDTLASA
jgi:hypothetical protein